MAQHAGQLVAVVACGARAPSCNQARVDLVIAPRMRPSCLARLSLTSGFWSGRANAQRAALAFVGVLGLETACRMACPLGRRQRRKKACVIARNHAPSATLQRPSLDDSLGLGTDVGVAYFWTFLNLGPKSGVAALRNVVEQHPDGRTEYVKLDGARGSGTEPVRFNRKRVPPQEGQGYGQFCILTPQAEERILGQYKIVDGIEGKRESTGVNVANASPESVKDSYQVAGISAQEADVSRTAGAALDYPICSDADIVAFEDVQDRVPLGIEKKFNIYIGPMTDEQSKEKLAPQMRKLPMGLPASCAAFRGAPFTGTGHCLGIVPHINEQQFVCTSGCETTWVRFDKKDLQTYDHNLDQIPVIEDEKGIMFPVTHLWVDFNFPKAACAFEWFSGRRCVVRKEIDLWPFPNALFHRLVAWAGGKLRGTDMQPPSAVEAAGAL